MNQFLKEYQGADPLEICKQFGWQLVPYQELSEKTGMTISELRELGEGFTLQVDGQTKIAYLEGPEEAFTIAHEIGHIIMGHLNSKRYKVQEGKKLGLHEDHEAQADEFAAALLDNATCKAYTYMEDTSQAGSRYTVPTTV